MHPLSLHPTSLIQAVNGDLVWAKGVYASRKAASKASAIVCTTNTAIALLAQTTCAEHSNALQYVCAANYYSLIS